MKILLTFFVLFFSSFVSLANDISDFKIEGIGIGESALKYFSESEILSNVKDRYKEYEDNDDIDVTEGYGRENYYWWHYTSQGQAEGNRGNEAETLARAIDYEEESPDFVEGGW